MTLGDLTLDQQKRLEYHAVDYLNAVAVARGRGRPNPERDAYHYKIRAYTYLTANGFGPMESIRAFKEMCAIVEGVTA